MQLTPPSPRVFSALLSGDIHELLSSSPKDLRPFLPSLARIVLAPPPLAPVVGVASSLERAGRRRPGEERRKVIHTLIAGMEEVNTIRSYLELNFQELRQDAIKEHQLLKKLGPEDKGQTPSILASSLQFGLAIEFERSDYLRRFRLFLSEIVKVMGQLDSSGPFKLIQSDLFECEAHLEEICDILCIAAAELPSLLPVVQLSEAMLRLRNGPHLLARVLANMSDTFDQVITSLVLNGETLDEVSLAGRCRTAAIRLLCRVHPAKSAYVQALAVSNCKHPTLAISLALEAEENRMRLHSFGMEKERDINPVLDPAWASGQAGVITLLHNIIITGDDKTRTWFSQYLKCMQQKYRRHKCSAVTKLRSYILNKLHSFNFPVRRGHRLEPPPLLPTKLQEESMEEDEPTSPPPPSLLMEPNPLEAESGHVTVSVKGGGPSSLEEVESVATSSSSETLEELVDQMEIEISDHEGEGSGDESSEVSEEEVGVVLDSGGGEGEEVVMSEKIETSTRITTGRGGGGGSGSISGSNGGISDTTDRGGGDGGGGTSSSTSGIGSTSGRGAGGDVMSGSLMGGEGGSGGGGGGSGVVTVGRRRKRSSTYEMIEFFPISLEKQLSNEDIIELMELLQVCCALKTQTQMYLKEEEAAAILSHIICTCPPFSPSGVRFIEVTLCVMLACPFLISIDGCESAVLKWFRWLLEKLPEFDKACGGHCSYGELLLLISIHLRERQLEQIEQLIENTLNMKVTSSLRSGHFTTLSKLFLQIFTEEVVCSHAVSVTPTSDLCADMKGHLPVHCIHQLIKMRNFRKYNIAIKDWIYEQLLKASEPLHPTLPPLLQEFVNSVVISSLTPSRNSSSSYGGGLASMRNHTPFSAQEVLSVFDRDPDTYQSRYSIPTQLLMLFYVLLYQDCYLTNLKALLVLPERERPCAYSPKVLTQIPMKYLLDHARLFQGQYFTLYPTLLKLTASQFPQLCLVCEWLTEKRVISAMEHDQTFRIAADKVTPELALKVLEEMESSPSQALLLLHHLSSLPPTSLVPYSHSITSTLTLLLVSPSVPRTLQELYVTIWTKLNTIIPRKLWLATVNALRPEETENMRPHTHQDIEQDPLIVLRCHLKVLRCPPIFDLVLRCLAAYTSTSKTWLHQQAHVLNCVSSGADPSPHHMNKPERDELCIAISATQESALIQILLEICLPTEEDKEFESSFGPQLTPLREIRCLICSYLHHTFIEEASLAKLVHFQGYPTELIPMMVSGIPSMHICLDFIPELLAQPRTEKQVFGVQLAAHVIHQYPVPESMGIAKDIFKRLTVLSCEIPADIREPYFMAVFDPITLLCKTFPPLCLDATEFLIHLMKFYCKPANGSLGSLLLPMETKGQRSSDAKDSDLPLAKAIKNTFDDIIKSITM